MLMRVEPGQVWQLDASKYADGSDLSFYLVTSVGQRGHAGVRELELGDVSSFYISCDTMLRSARWKLVA